MKVPSSSAQRFRAWCWLGALIVIVSTSCHPNITLRVERPESRELVRAFSAGALLTACNPTQTTTINKYLDAWNKRPSSGSLPFVSPSFVRHDGGATSPSKAPTIHKADGLKRMWKTINSDWASMSISKDGQSCVANQASVSWTLKGRHTRCARDVEGVKGSSTLTLSSIGDQIEYDDFAVDDDSLLAQLGCIPANPSTCACLMPH